MNQIVSSILRGALLAGVFAAPVSAFQFDWGSADVNWNDGNLGPQVFTNVDGSGVDVTVEVTGDTFDMQSGTPALYNVGGETDLRIFPDFTDKTQSATITLTFSQPVTIDNFIVRDLDGTPGSWTDGVIITALQDNTFDESPNDIQWGSLITVVDSNKFEPFGGTSVAYDDPAGWLTTSFNKRPVTRISVKQYPGEVAGDDPGAGAITLSEFGFFTDLPLDVTKVADTAGPLNPGDTVNYTVSVTNNRTTSETQVELVDTLPAGMTYQAGSTVVDAFVAVPAATDDFSSGGYNGGSGWNGRWRRLNPNNSPLIQIVGERARFEGVSGSDPYMRRRISQDLSGATSVILQFDLDTSGNLDNDGDTDEFAVYASSDGGNNWSLVASYTDDVTGPQQVDITAWASTNTAIRFGVDAWVFPANGNNQDQYYYVDNVSVLPSFGTGTPQTFDNAVGGFPDLADGSPGGIITLADAMFLPPGETITATYSATVDLPSAMGAINVVGASTGEYSDQREALVQVPVTQSCAIAEETVPVRAEEDDGYWVTNGTTRAYFYRNFVEIGDTGTEGGFRFLGINIPPGAVINSAVLELTGFSSGGGAGSAEVTIAANDSADASAFLPLPPGSLTTATVDWVIGAVSPGVALQSPDLASVVQELVDSYGGLDNAALALVLEGTGTTNRRFEAYRASSTPGMATLAIDWECGDLDYGDAPLGYGEVRHLVPATPTVYLGTGDAPDAETAQLYSAAADGDDSNNVNDENGVSFRSPGGTNQSIFADVEVVTGSPVTVCGWLDRPDGTPGGFEAADGQCSAVSSSQTVTFQWANLPVDAQYTTFARFRVSSDALTTADAEGTAGDGEVEDYSLQFNFTPTSAVIDNFRVELVWVDDIRAASVGGGKDDSGGNGTVNDDSDDGAAPGDELAAALEGLEGDSQLALVKWETLQERGTQGFYLERRSQGKRRWERVNADRMLPGLIVSPLGGEYLLLDPGAEQGQRYRYRLVEQEIWGTTRTYGPWTVTIGEASRDAADAGLEVESRAGQDKSEPSRWGQWRKLKKGYAARPRLADDETRKQVRAERRSSRRDAKRAARRASKAGQALRLRTTQESLQRLELATMSDLSGLPLRKLDRQLNRGRWQLSQGGQPLAYHYAEDEQALYFAGEALRTRDSLENVYQLHRGRGATMARHAGSGPLAVEAGRFRDVLAFEENPFLLAHVHSEEDADYAYWDYVNSNGKPSATLTLPVPDPAAGGDRGALVIALRGVVPGTEQRARASLNGVSLDGEISWSGNAAAELVVPFEAADLLDAGTVGGMVMARLTISGEAVSGGDVVFMIDRVELRYDRETRAHEDQLWLHDVDAGVITVDGFSGPGIRMLEDPVGDAARWREDVTIEQAADGSWQLSFIAEGGDYLLSGAAQPATAETDRPSSLRDAGNGTPYLVIAPRELAESAEAMAAYRSQRFGNVQIAWLQDIYDEFAHGRTDSGAVQAFLKHVHASWREVPEYVLIMGRGTLDHADSRGLGDSLVPLRMVATPWGLAPSDNRYADVNGDHVPDFLLGRLSVSSDAGAMAYIEKLIAFEAAPVEAWSGWAAVVADDSDEAGDFYGNADEAGGLMALGGYGVESLYHPDDTVADSLLAGLQAGAWALVNYNGHGTRTTLGSRTEGFLDTAAVADLHNGSSLPIFSALTCGALDSSYPGVLSLGDALVNQPGGGSIASFAATGLSLDPLAHPLNLAWLNALLDGVSIAGAAQRARQEGFEAGLPSYMLDVYGVAGDPAVELKSGE